VGWQVRALGATGGIEGVRSVIERFLDRLMWWLEQVLAYAFIVAVAINFVNVVGRYAFGFTMLAADELQIYIMVFMTFLGAGVVAWRRKHLRMDVLVNVLPKRVRVVVHTAELVVLIALSAFVLWQSSFYAWQMHVFGRVSDMAGVPMWIPHGAVAVGFGLIAIVTFVQLVRPPVRAPRLPESDKGD
jgi:TRAP-type transport system small permease protein